MALTDLHEIRADLHEAGLRATPARIAVLTVLRVAARPMSHGDVVDALADSPYNRATLYRNLMDMVEAGLLRRVELGDHLWRFEEPAEEGAHAHDARAHAHFICVRCGTVSCLPEVHVNVGAPSAPAAVRDRDVEVQLRGVCDDCD